MNAVHLSTIRRLVLTGIFAAGMLCSDAWLRQERRVADTAGTDAIQAPLVDFVAVSLGGFRGILVDGLWLRASYLQDSGRYMELVQLADWISRLEPEAADVWAYHAWNLAYNVSVMMVRPEDRWRWVKHGISLLRDEGLHHAPRDPALYRELSWMFLHKVAGIADNAHEDYLRYWTSEMAACVPDGHLPAENSEAARILERSFGMDRERMAALEARFAPLDWRLPQSQAVYWAALGLEHTAPSDIRGARTLYQALTLAAREGALTEQPGGNLSVGPNLGLLEPTCRYFEALLADARLTAREMPYIYFLGDALPLWHSSGDEGRAREAYRRIVELAGPDLPLPSFEALARGTEELGDMEL